VLHSHVAQMHRIVPINPERAFERVAEQILDAIRMGELSVGDRLPSERELAAGMQISRPSLREAIQVLKDTGVLEVRRGPAGGVFVASIDIPRELLRSKVEVRGDEVRSVLEARRLLEPRVAHLAAVHATDEDFARMQATIDAQKDMLEHGTFREHPERFPVQDVHFHLRMAAATHNSTIISMMRALQGRLEFARDFISHEDANREWVIDIHERTLSAIRLADHELIEVVMEEHIRELELAWERSTESSIVRALPDFLVPLDERQRLPRDAVQTTARRLPR
jgi:GntR family transcriptional repressor for pyruvate dehydrogenase complex